MAVAAGQRAIQWRVAPIEQGAGDELARALGLQPVTGRLLARRGIRTAAQAFEFLSPQLDSLHDPFLLPDAKAAAERVSHAIDTGETIFVHGDYDVDGVTSAALLTRVLGRLGGRIVPFVPSRFREGYGVRVSTVERAREEGAGLLLTSDCGVSAHDACERAAQIGLDVVVTDHHECPNSLPPAIAVVNPSRKDSRYPCPHLAGVGVAYKVCEAVCRLRGVPAESLHKHFLDLVALGTISDVAPLTGENSTFAYHGLQAIAATSKPGLLALIDASGLRDSGVSAEHVGFRLGPRINAAGRLAEASAALELFLTSDHARASDIASEMSRANQERQDEQARILEEALELIEQDGLADDRVIIVGKDGWHAGVIGIVAGKIADIFYRPAVVLRPEDGIWKGSARSIEGFSLAEALDELRPLVSGGGHAMAAGMHFAADDLTEVRRAFNALADEWLTEEDLLPRLDIEMELDIEDVGPALAYEIETLAPFGVGNPEPLFVTRGARLADVRTMGAEQQHFRASLAGTRAPVSVVGFSMGEEALGLDPARTYAICYNLRVGRFNGREQTEVILQDIPSAEGLNRKDQS